jgi:adenine deaminase
MKNEEISVSGKIIDIHKREIFPGRIIIKGGKIYSIEPIEICPDVYIMPGLIDSHVHIESSMITPGAFAVAAVSRGTIGVVSDPHEIANVMGIDGVNFMIEDAKTTPLKVWFGAPSCVPATSFETSGAVVDHKEIEKLLNRAEIKYLSEMMNFPGVIYGDAEVIKKIEAAHHYNKPIDGHAPGLSGDMLRKYVNAGISTDHECSTLNEALEKISLGMKILIREGSAARNLEALKDLFVLNPAMVMLCSDDLHPEMLMERHINLLVSKLVNEGYDLFDVLRSATINPVSHYNLDAGLLRIGDSADFIVVDSPEKMNVIQTWIDGELVYSDGKTLFSYKPGKDINNFRCSPISQEQIIVVNRAGESIRVIEAMEGELLTHEIIIKTGKSKFVEPDIKDDILKIVIKDRYKDSAPVIGFIKGFGLKSGAFASSVAHDSHNIIAVGTNDSDIVSAINEIVRLNGGLAVSDNGKISSFQLNIGGIMSTRSCAETAAAYQQLNSHVHDLGCKLKAPFMTLSFMALLVIPDLKIGDRGLFDIKQFKPVPLFV